MHENLKNDSGHRIFKISHELINVIGFLILATFYFAFYDEDGCIVFSTLLKVTPICFLQHYIYRKGFRNYLNEKYSKHILTGMIASSVGDILLNVKHFHEGMAAFGVAHIFYIRAFGLIPCRFDIGGPILILAAIVTYYVYSVLDNILKVGLPIYAVLLSTMCWRAVVRPTKDRNWFKLSCAGGGVLFVISDFLICLDMFIYSFSTARIYIMITYYMAQLFIAASIWGEMLANDVFKSGNQKVKSK